jgi:hypothetical protein
MSPLKQQQQRSQIGKNQKNTKMIAEWGGILDGCPDIAEIQDFYKQRSHETPVNEWRPYSWSNTVKL